MTYSATEDKIQCSECGEPPTEGDLTQYDDGWNCSSCGYFNSEHPDQHTTSTVDRGNDIPDEIERMMKVISFTLLVYSAIFTFTDVQIRSSILIGIVVLEILLGLGEYVFVKLGIEDGRVEEYRKRRKRGISRGMDGLLDVISTLTLFAIIFGALYFFDNWLL